MIIMRSDEIHDRSLFHMQDFSLKEMFQIQILVMRSNPHNVYGLLRFSFIARMKPKCKLNRVNMK